MPIIIHTQAQTLEKVPFDTDENRMLLKGAQANIQNRGECVCAIVDESFLVADAPEYYKILTTGPNAAPTLDNQIREQMKAEIAKKKQQLLDAYPTPGPTFNLANSPNNLDHFPWPNPQDDGLTEFIKFKGNRSPAYSTGFHIGNGLVVTAAHCVEALGAFNMGKYRLIFNFTDETKIKKGNVFSIRRIVHYNANTEAEAPHLPIHSIHIDMAKVEQFTQKYDVAILEIIAVNNDQKLPAALKLQQAPATVIPRTRVYSIGCSHGLPFVYANGGDKPKNDPFASSVRGIPDPKNPPDHQGSITADIDVFKGNSGGPLFNAETHEVIGICRSGMIVPWITDKQSPDAANPGLQKAVRDWIKTRVQPQGLIFNPEWLDYYTELRAIKDNSRLSWVRFKGDSGAIVRTNAFSRTDTLSFLSTSVRDSLKRTNGHFTLEISISDGLPLAPGAPAPRLNGNLTLTINGLGTDQTQTSSKLVLNGGAWVGKQNTQLQWILTTSPPGGPGLPGPDASNIGILGMPSVSPLMDWPGGLLSWDSLTLTRTANSAGDGFHGGELEPNTGRIVAKFWLPRPNQPGQYLPPIAYALDMVADANTNASSWQRVPNSNNNQWKIDLGIRHGRNARVSWAGPL